MTLVAVAAADTTTTTGTGAVTLSGTAQAITINGIPATTFATGFTLGGTISYPISKVGYQISDGTNTETGLGTLTSATNLTRDQILASSNGGRHVNFIAGTKTVVSATTAWNSTEPTWTSVPPDTLPENDVQSGTFTATVNSGSTATTGTVRYKVNGAGQVTLSFPTITGSASGTTLTITGIPAILGSVTTKNIPLLVTGTSAGAVIVPGLASLAAAGTVQGTATMTLSQYTSLTTGYSATFTTATTTGVPAQDVSYNLF